MNRRLFPALLVLLPSFSSMAGPDQPFNGKDLSGMEIKNKAAAKWQVGEAVVSSANAGSLEVKPGGAALVNAVTGHGQSHDIFTKEKYGDIRLEVEVMVPRGSNSGIYLMGEYEVQVFDSHGKK